MILISYINFNNLDVLFIYIDWKDTFKEAEKEPQSSHKLSFEIDPGLTAGNNKQNMINNISIVR